MSDGEAKQTDGMAPEAKRIGRAFFTAAFIALAAAGQGWLWGAWDWRPLVASLIVIAAVMAWAVVWEHFDGR